VLCHEIATSEKVDLNLSRRPRRRVSSLNMELPGVQGANNVKGSARLRRCYSHTRILIPLEETASRWVGCGKARHKVRFSVWGLAVSCSAAAGLNSVAELSNHWRMNFSLQQRCSATVDLRSWLAEPSSVEVAHGTPRILNVEIRWVVATVHHAGLLVQHLAWSNLDFMLENTLHALAEWTCNLMFPNA